MTSKHTSISNKKADLSSSKDKFFLIDQKIQKLREKRERLHIHQALSFAKEAEKILKEEFSPELALSVLEKTWATASKEQKQTWRDHSYSFRSYLQTRKQNATLYNSAPQSTQLIKDHSDAHA